MNIGGRSAVVVVIVGAVLAASTGAVFLASADRSTEDRLAIERLHQLDVKVTLSGKADDLATEWDSEAVRILPGRPAEVGKAVIYAGDKREEAPSLCYKAEMKDLQIAGDWAFEWGYFSYKQSANSKPGRGKVLRVMKRQPDGSWKFARVIGFTEELESAAPMPQACE